MEKHGNCGSSINGRLKKFKQGQPSTSHGYSSSQSRIVTPAEPSQKNPHLFNIHHHGSKVVTYRNVHPTEDIYDEILDLITNDYIEVENIVEVNNPFLKKAYQLKKAQKLRQFGDFEESLVFHGTKKVNVDKICTWNFNWRLYGTNFGHKYGKGVAFSRNAKYASCYSDEDFHKVMIVAKVQIADVCQGNKDMILPPDGYDTSQKGDDGVVLVKYEDNEFYPAYKLYYHIDDEEEDEEDDDYWEPYLDDDDDYYFEDDGGYYWDADY